jgi:hypothetical protein
MTAVTEDWSDIPIHNAKVQQVWEIIYDTLSFQTNENRVMFFEKLLSHLVNICSGLM